MEQPYNYIDLPRDYKHSHDPRTLDVLLARCHQLRTADVEPSVSSAVTEATRIAHIDTTTAETSAEREQSVIMMLDPQSMVAIIS